MAKPHLSSLLLFAMSFLAVGCGGPVLSIRHVLPPDLPAPYYAQAITVGRFTTASGPENSYADKTAEILKEQLVRRIREGKSTDLGNSGIGPVIVTGEVHVETKDRKGNKTIRRRGSEASVLTSSEVETLIRTAVVRVDFIITRKSDNVRLGAAETRRAYSSLTDPRVRGDLGLGRPDDPAAVPKAGTIVNELLEKCVDTFCRMITPPVVVAEVQLRGTLQADGQKALAAAEARNWKYALAHARAAVRAEPNNVNLLFNLAAIAEACGELKTALDRYEQVVKQTGGRDRQAGEAVVRLRRVLARKGRPSGN
ncbi:MAG: hypothetical protein KAV00_13555 [Phycisphaerae bacterium]|nr:hypothetical protein [Phycisphaerae bacterium]